MIRYIRRRLLDVVPTLAGILLLTFVTFHVVGGSPAEVVLGQHASAETLAAFEARHGYDKPLFFGRWSRVRAFADWIPEASGESRTEEGTPSAGSNSFRDRLTLPPFRYPLPEGTYRCEILSPKRFGEREIQVTVVGRDGASTNRINRGFTLRGDRSEAVFMVPAGMSAIEAAIRMPWPRAQIKEIRLRRQTDGFFDSQFVHFIGDLLRGDLGFSISYGRRVRDVLRGGVGPSLALTVPIFILTLIPALAAAVFCAAFRGRAIDRFILGVCAVLMSINYVVWVIGGQYLLAYRWGWFPIWGFESWRHLALPVLIGVLSGIGRDTRYYRTVILDESKRDHVRAALSRGRTPWQVWTRHVLLNSLIPIATQISMTLPFLFMGSLLLESFFGIPGIGGVSINAIQSGDMSVVRAVVILGAFLYQSIMLGTDILSAWLDPRVRLQ